LISFVSCLPLCDLYLSKFALLSFSLPQQIKAKIDS